MEEQVRAAPKIEQSKRIRVHALVSSSASVVPRLAQNPISGGVSHGAADKADNAGLNQLEITARPELPPKGTPEIFVSFAWGDDSYTTSGLDRDERPGKSYLPAVFKLRRRIKLIACPPCS